jgi:hypothetical protein
MRLRWSSSSISTIRQIPANGIDLMDVVKMDRVVDTVSEENLLPRENQGSGQDDGDSLG